LTCLTQVSLSQNGLTEIAVAQNIDELDVTARHTVVKHNSKLSLYTRRQKPLLGFCRARESLTLPARNIFCVESR